MARSRKPAAEPEPKADLEVTGRDFVMARLAAGQSYAQGAIEAIQEALAMFLTPDDDDDGKERAAAVQAALEQLGCASRALEAAEEALDDADMQEIEPWEDA